VRRILLPYLQLANLARSEIRSTSSCRAPLRTFSRLPSGGFEDHKLDTQRKPLRGLSPRGRGTE
jgi:hypothetical protein